MREETFTYLPKCDLYISGEISPGPIETRRVENSYDSFVEFINTIAKEKEKVFTRLPTMLHEELARLPSPKPIDTFFWNQSGYFTFGRQSGVTFHLLRKALVYSIIEDAPVIYISSSSPQTSKFDQLVNLHSVMMRDSGFKPNMVNRKIRSILASDLKSCRGLRDYLVLGDNVGTYFNRNQDTSFFRELVQTCLMSRDLVFMDTIADVKTEMFTATS